MLTCYSCLKQLQIDIMKRARADSMSSLGSEALLPQDSEAEIMGSSSSSDASSVADQGDGPPPNKPGDGDGSEIGLAVMECETQGQQPDGLESRSLLRNEFDHRAPSESKSDDKKSDDESDSSTLVLGGGKVSDLQCSDVSALALSIFDTDSQECPVLQTSTVTEENSQQSIDMDINFYPGMRHDGQGDQDHNEIEKRQANTPGPKLLPGPKPFQHGLKLPPLDHLAEDDIPAVHWRRSMAEYFENKFEKIAWKRPIRLGTTCSGSGAPRIGMRLMGLPLTERYSSDPRSYTLKMSENLEDVPQHHFLYASDVARGEGHCCVHNKHCQIGGHIRDDLFIGGFPCQPFSTQRPDRFKAPWTSHSQTYVMYDVAKCCATSEPKLVLLENVPGFLSLRSEQRTQPKCLIFIFPRFQHPDSDLI